DGTGRGSEQLVAVTQVLHERARLYLELETEQQALAAHAVEQLRVVAVELLEARADALALLAHLGEEGLLGYHVEHGVAGGHRQRIAAVRRAVRAEGHPPRRLLGGEAGADREPPAEAFRGGEDVGFDPVLLVDVERAG